MSGGQLQAMLFMMHQPEPIRQSSLLMVLATGIGHAPSLMNGLKALENESKGNWQRRVESLRLLLSEGRSLYAALATTKGLVPEQTLMAIRVAETTGTLKQVLADEAHRLMQRGADSNPVRPTATMTLVWMLGLGTIAWLIVSFIMIFIIPKFKEIFNGFDVELPALTVQLVSMSDVILGYWYFLLFPAFSLTCALAVLLLLASLRRLKTGHIWFTESFPRYWTPMILRLLSVTVATEKSLTEGLGCILNGLQHGRASEKLNGVLESVNAGSDCWESLGTHGFLKAREVRFLESSAKTHHLDWGLQHLSRTLESRRTRWLGWCQMVIQVGALAIGSFVIAFIVLCLFLPLIKLLNDLA